MADFIHAPTASIPHSYTKAASLPFKLWVYENGIPVPVQVKVTKAKKTIAPVKAKKSAIGKKAIKLTYSAMITKAVLELKEKKGSSRQLIMKYLQGTYKVRMDLGL